MDDKPVFVDQVCGDEAPGEGGSSVSQNVSAGLALEFLDVAYEIRSSAFGMMPTGRYLRVGTPSCSTNLS